MSDEVRKMTIKRGLTRKKIIESQLSDIVSKIKKYGACSTKAKIDLVETNNVSRQKNHDEARKEVSSLYQKFNDLTSEYAKIKDAIDRANLETKINVAGRTMSINEALTYQRNIASHVLQLTSAYNQSVNHAQNMVERYNNSINLGKEEETK